MRDAKAASLADRVSMNSGMFANGFAGSVHDLATLRHFVGAIFMIEIAIDELRVLTIGDETYLLRLLLVGGVEVRIASDLAHFALEHLAEREVSARKLVLSQ